LISSIHRSEFENILGELHSSINSNFISEIINYSPINLGHTEEDFLYLISIAPQSAFSISLELKRIKHETKQKKGMAYGNILKRVKRLQILGLIEKEGKYRRNQIKYKITSRGIFELMLKHGLNHETILKQKDNVIIQSLVYQFFELETIRKFVTLPRRFALNNYFRHCSDEIMAKLDFLRNAPYVFSAEEIIIEFEDLILREIQKFVFLIIVQLRVTALTQDPQKELTYLKNKELWRWRWGRDDSENGNGPNYVDLFPKPALMRDMKFLKILTEIVTEFDNGCKDYRSSLLKD
jgi:hypothetical protein